MAEPGFGPGPDPLGLGLKVQVKVRDLPRPNPEVQVWVLAKCPEPELDWTMASLVRVGAGGWWTKNGGRAIESGRGTGRATQELIGPYQC